MDFGNLTGGLGRVLVIFGLLIAVVGLVLIFEPKIPRLGRLQGDIAIKRDNFTFYFPLATLILISIVITVLLRIFRG